MKNKPILILAGDPRSIFLEILFKSYKKNKFKSPLVLVSSKKILVSQMKKYRFKKKIRLIHAKDIKNSKLNPGHPL